MVYDGSAVTGGETGGKAEEDRSRLHAVTACLQAGHVQHRIFIAAIKKSYF